MRGTRGLEWRFGIVCHKHSKHNFSVTKGGGSRLGGEVSPSDSCLWVFRRGSSTMGLALPSWVLGDLS